MIRVPLSKLFYKAVPGRVPGIKAEELSSERVDEAVEVTCIEYGPEEVKIRSIANLSDLFVEDRPESAVVRWINVSGLSDRGVIGQLGEQYRLHALTIEDILHVPQRPKVEMYPAVKEDHLRLFVIAQMSRLINDTVTTEQVSICVGEDTVITFQERTGDVWDPIRNRIKQEGSRFRGRRTGYLTYALLDAIIDHNFSILEHYGAELEHLEGRVLEGVSADVITRIHQVKRELLMLRRHVWPMREVVHTLQREENEYVSDETRLFLRDAYDHAVQVLDVVETYREVAGGIADTHMTVVGNRMNEVMKTLTMVATVFIPISFLAGVFGMNFDGIPGLRFQWGFTVFCIACAAVAGGMMIWFRRRGWW